MSTEDGKGQSPLNLCIKNYLFPSLGCADSHEVAEKDDGARNSSV